MTKRLQEFDVHNLQVNLFFTQLIVLVIAAISSLVLFGWKGTLAFFAYPGSISLVKATGFSFLIVVLSIAMERYLPKQWQDDGGVNEYLFRGLAILPTLVLCLMVGISEEMLFRGVLQSLIGNTWTSLLFTLIHIRYVRKPLLLISVFITSFGLGLLFELESQLWPPVLAHFLIDLLLALYLQRVQYREGRM